MVACRTYRRGRRATRRGLSSISNWPDTLHPATADGRDPAEQALRRALPVQLAATVGRRSPDFVADARRLSGRAPRRRQRGARRPDRRRCAAGADRAPAAQAREDLLGAGRRRRPTRRSSRRSRAASTLRDGRHRARRGARAIAAPRRRCGRAIRRSAWPQRFPTAWLELATPRRTQPAGAAHDRRGRPADAATRCAGRSGAWTLQASRRANGGAPRIPRETRR